eukprot:101119_1
MWNRVKTVVLNMGQPLSVLTALVVFSATIQAGCIHDDDPAYVVPPDEKIDCSQDSTGQELGEAACKATTGCKWEESHTVKATPSKSKTIVEFKDGRILKSLPPIEAILEYIGDAVYYEQLCKHIPTTYDREGVLKPIFAEDSKPTIQEDPKRYQVDQPKDAMHHIALLQYSRPLLDTKPFPQPGTDRKRRGVFSGVELKSITFTLSNVVSIAYIAWWDALIMNFDRFAIAPKIKNKPNSNNMMLYDKTPAKAEKSYLYVPIDQGFAQMITWSWFDYPRSDFLKGNVWFSEDGWKHVTTGTVEDSSTSKKWTKWYEEWVTRFDRKRAEEFVDDNLVYFPKMGDELKAKIIDIIHSIWIEKGVELCTDMGVSINQLFNQIDNTGDETWHKAWTALEGNKMWNPTKVEWEKVKETINKQIEMCTNNEANAVGKADVAWAKTKGFFRREKITKEKKEKKEKEKQEEIAKEKSAAEPLWKAIHEKLAEDPNIEDFTMAAAGSGAAVGAKRVQYDSLYLDIDSKDVREDSDEQYDGEHSRVYYAHLHRLPYDKYQNDWNGFVVGGLFGGTTIVVIVLVFCIGLACGMISCRGYKHHKGLEGE